MVIFSRCSVDVAINLDGFFFISVFRPSSDTRPSFTNNFKFKGIFRRGGAYAPIGSHIVQENRFDTKAYEGGGGHQKANICICAKEKFYVLRNKRKKYQEIRTVLPDETTEISGDRDTFAWWNFRNSPFYRRKICRFDPFWVQIMWVSVCTFT